MSSLPPDLVGSAAHVFCDDLDRPVLSQTDRDHLAKSLRLSDGELVTVADGVSYWRTCTFRIAKSSAGKGALIPHGTGAGPARGKSCFLEVSGPIQRVEPPRQQVRVAFGPTGSSSAREVAQRLSEVGVDVIVPMLSERCTSRWGGDGGVKLVRGLRKVVREASMQARRVWLPEVCEVTSFSSVVDAWAEEAWLAHPVAGGSEDPSEDPGARLSVLVGPEGGFSPKEVEVASARLPVVALGPTVMRAETAAVVAGALMAARRHSSW